MDAVRISHLRVFANAVASALQNADSRQVVDASQLQNMLGAFARSVDASVFIAESAQVAQAPIAASPAQKLNAEPAGSGPLVTVQTVKENLLLPAAPPQNKPAPVSGILASQFFLALPWMGRQYAAPRQQTLLKSGAESERTQATAASFFASLPWGTKLQPKEVLRIGSGADHAQQAALLASKLAPQALPAMFSHGMPLSSTSHMPNKLSSTNPVGYFSKLPWAGRQASQNSQN